MFYDRHVKALLGYFARRTFNPEEAADLTAETFASALVARKRFKPGGPPATAWLFAIASRRLADYQRRGRVEQRTRRSLAMERRAVSEADAEMIRMLGRRRGPVGALRAAARAAPDRGRARDRRAPLRRAVRRAAHVGGGGAPARLARPRDPAAGVRAMTTTTSPACARTSSRRRRGSSSAARAARVARPLRPRAWSPLAVLGAAARGGAALLVVVLRSARSRRRPARRPQDPRARSTSAASRATPWRPVARCWSPTTTGASSALDTPTATRAAQLRRAAGRRCRSRPTATPSGS